VIRLDPGLFAINPGLRLAEAAHSLIEAVEMRR
jgi:hypothetical protein